MPLKNKDRRLALRFCVYIQALGAVPVPYEGQALKVYLVELQQQYEKLQQELGPEIARAARVAGRITLRGRGFAHAATIFPIPVPPVPKKRGGVSSPQKARTPNPPVQTGEPNPRAAARAALFNCLRKIRHPNFLSALLHARRLKDEDIRIYPCAVCDGLHVGHASGLTKRRRKIAKQLEVLLSKLQEIDRTRELLLRQERKLRSELAATLEEQNPAHMAAFETEEDADMKSENASEPPALNAEGFLT